MTLKRRVYLIYRLIKSYFQWRFIRNHQCHYSLDDMVLNKSENDICIPLTAWVYRCYCGKEIVEITESGVKQIANGVPYEAVTGQGDYAYNRLSEGNSERIQRKKDKLDR